MSNNPVDEAILSRHSVRAYLDTPVPRETVEEILRVASFAPSGTNMQPWKVYVLTGKTLEKLTSATMEAYNDRSYKPEASWKYYPDEFPEPYKSRRKKLGAALYGLMGIEKSDRKAMWEQMGRNYTFFDAPVGLMFTIDSRLEVGSWLDYGTFMQNIMIAARARGLDTCPQAAWPPYHAVIRSVLNIGDDETIVSGMALGHKDPSAPENDLRSDRVPVNEFVTFLD